MKKDNKVSAVIITHNRKKMLSNAIRSVLNQTYNNIELIVVNDNSTDGTKEYLQDLLKKEEIKVININEAHSRGGGYARNVGIRNSTGNYIAFLDDDDVWNSQKIQKQVSFLDKNPSYGMVYCRRIDKDYSSDTQKLESTKGKMSGNLSNTCFTKTVCTSSSMMVRKEIFYNIGGFDEKLQFWQDFELNIRIAHYTLIGFLNEPLMVYSLGNNDKGKLTNKFTGWWNSINYIESKHKNYFMRLPNETIKAWKIMIYKDAARRCKKSQLYTQERSYRYKVWQLDKSIYNLLRLIINY